MGCNRVRYKQGCTAPGTATEDGLKLEISNIVLRISCIILLWHSLGIPFNYQFRKKWDCKFVCLCSVNKDDQIHSNMICAFASVQNTSFFHASLHLLAMLNFICKATVCIYVMKHLSDQVRLM